MMQSGTRLGPYEILEWVGAGGIGEVYRARDSRLQRIVAIKLLPGSSAASPGRRERLAREARAVSSLAHPHICALYDAGSQDGIDYLVMEYLDGETLEMRLLRGPLGLEEAVGYAVEIADALAHAHGRGVIHRDLKPGNIILTASGVKLIDFGLATLAGAALGGEAFAETLSLTSEHRVVGTPRYMAPEQIEGRAIDARTDIFALGAVVYEMLSGRRAFDGSSTSAVMAAILTREPPAVSAVRPSLEGWREADHLIARCLAKRPDDRWQSARDLAAELKWVASGLSSGVPARRRIAWPRRTRIRAMVAGAAVLAVVALMAVAWELAVPKRAMPAADVIRFTIAPPPHSAFSPSGNFMALSPDGRRLAFVATPAGAQPLLWIRPLDREAAYPLPGTEEAGQPFWSADSRSLAFLAHGRLMRIDPAGGTPVTICDALSTLAGAWSRDGVIVFRQADGLYRVSAGGGAPAPVTRLAPSRGERAHGWPAFLPDQRHLLFEILSDRPEYTGIFVGSLDSDERVRLVDVSSNAIFVEPGYLMYTRGGIVVVQRFDAARRQTIGDPIPLVEGVPRNVYTGKSAFSVSNTGVLAYRTVGRSELRLVDRRGRTTATLGEPAPYVDPALSPNGTSVAVARLDPTTGSSRVWVIDATRSVASRLTGAGSGVTDPSSDDTAPVWSPDGKDIIFQAHRGRLFSVCRKGSNAGDREEILYSSPYFMTPTDWSRDGRTVLCQGFGKGVSLLKWDGPSLPKLQSWSAGGSDQGRLSPGGGWIAYASAESGRDEVYLRPLVGEGKWRLSTSGGAEPRWRGDGREIFYLEPDGTMMAVNVRIGASVEVGVPQRLFQTGLSGLSTPLSGRNQYDVSRDGQRFLINQPVTTSTVTVVLNWTALLPR